MFEIPVWAIWLSLGVILIVGEIFTATFFIFCFGLAALITALLAWFGCGAGVQWICFLAVSTLTVLLVKVLGDKFAVEPDRKAGVDRCLNQKGLVIERVDSANSTGRVRVLHEEWRAQSAEGEIFEVDETVLVKGVRGTHLVVTRVNGG